MRIAFFEVTEQDKKYLLEKLPGQELLFFEEPLTEDNVALASECEIISVFIYSTVNETVLQALPHLRCIATRSTGYDHIDTVFCKERNISVQNVPYYGENTVAEHTFALILALSRNVHKSYLRGKQNDYSIDGLVGFDLKDKTLGVIGTGHIGLHVIRIAKGFGMHVLAYDTTKNTFLSEVLHFSYAPLDKVLSQSDIVTLHVPYNEKTHYLINRESITKMKTGSLLINTSRGGIIETEAMIEALDKGILGGAGLDVVEGEEHIKEENQSLNSKKAAQEHDSSLHKNLLDRENVVFTPHIAFYSKEALERILDTTISNILQFTEEKVENAVQIQ